MHIAITIQIITGKKRNTKPQHHYPNQNTQQ
jgi:hypothetical protein